MALNSLLIVAFSLAVTAASSAEAQTLGLGQLLINGTVHCSAGTGTTNTAVFPNARVQLQCGTDVISTTTTNANGVFSMPFSFITSLLPTLVRDCKLVVMTPLSTCDTSLPANGVLQSALQLPDLGGLISGIVGVIGGILGPITHLVPSGFELVQ